MIKVIISVYMFLVLVSCNYSRIDGQYNLDTENKSNGVFKALKEIVVQKITFNEGYCSFSYFGRTINGTYEVNEDYIYINTSSDLGIIKLEIIDKNTLLGEGWLAGRYKKNSKN